MKNLGILQLIHEGNFAIVFLNRVYVPATKSLYNHTSGMNSDIFLNYIFFKPKLFFDSFKN